LRRKRRRAGACQRPPDRRRQWD